VGEIVFKKERGPLNDVRKGARFRQPGKGKKGDNLGKGKVSKDICEKKTAHYQAVRKKARS